MASDASLELEGDRRREFRRLLVVSAAFHAVLVGALAFSPGWSAMNAPAGVLSVDLVSLPGTPARKPRAAPAPRPKPAPPVPAAAPKPAPPVPKKRVLPQEAPTPRPRPRQKELPPEAVQRPREPEKDYGDVLDQLRAEAGESAPEAAAEPEPERAAAPVAGGGGTGPAVSPEIADWMRRARIHVRQSWVVPAGFRQQSLATAVDVRLDAGGNVIGEPEIVRRSGNPWYDDGVVRSIKRASPLPAPPEAAVWNFVFVSDELS